MDENINYYDFNNIEDKHFFAGYYNLANDNFYNVLKELKYISDKKLDITEINKASYSELDTRLNKLQRFLPFIPSLVVDKEIKDQKFEITTLLKFLWSEIEKQRNFYTHYAHNRPEFILESNQQILNHYFIKAVELIKKSVKDELCRNSIREHFSVEFNELKVLQKRYIEEKIRNSKSNSEKKKYSLDEESINNGIFNKLFKPYIIKDKVTGILSINNYRLLFDSSGYLTKHGHLFLLSLFLKRDQMESLMDKIEGYKASHKLYFHLTRRIYSHFCFKGIKRQIVSQHSKTKLMLQMADELGKIPEELYNLLNNNEKAEFIVDINEYYKDNDQNGENPDEKRVIHDVVRRRYKQTDKSFSDTYGTNKTIDKFEYFALRFFDEDSKLKNIKFMIDWGNVIIDKRSKNILDMQTERIIKKRVTVFENINTVIDKKIELVNSNNCNGQILIDEENSTCLIEGYPFPANPSYYFQGHNIPIYLSYNNKKEADCEDTEINKVRNAVLKNTLGDNVFPNKPNALLSLYELPAMLHVYFNHANKEKEVFKLLINKYFKYKKDLNFKENINDNQLVHLKKIKNNKILLEKNEYTFNRQKLVSDINKEIIKTEIKINEFNKCKLEYHDIKNKRKYLMYNSEKGLVATFLADEILRWMPRNLKENWKGYHHSELQKLLSFFQIEKNNINHLIIFDDKFDFLRDIFKKSNSLEDLYINYLNGKIEKLKSFLSILDIKEKKVLKKGLCDIWVFFKQSKYNIKNINSYSEELLKKPILLGRGIFDDTPTFYPSDLKDNPKANWFETVKKNQSYQSFYNLLEDKLKPVSGESSVEKRRRIEKYRSIEYQKIKDIYTLEMFKHLYKEIFGNEEIMENITLTDFYQSPAERKKMIANASSQNNRNQGNCSKNKYNELGIWNKVTPCNFENGRVVAPQIKLKEIGKFEQLLLDDKVKAILSYNDQIWQKQELERELESYRIVREEKLFKIIHNLEKVILEIETLHREDKSHPIIFNNGEYPNFRKYIENSKIFNWSQEDKNIINCFNSELLENSFPEIIVNANPRLQKAILLIYIRNKFAHNQLPSKHVHNFCKKISCINDERVTTYAEFYLMIVENFILDQNFIKTKQVYNNNSIS